MTLSSLTQTEAAERSRLITVDRYDIEVDLTGLLEGEVFSSVSTISFASSEPGASTFVDCVADISRATLNGVDLDLSTAAHGRLPLPTLAADNLLVVEASTSNTASGEGILRTVDPTDKLVYVWTSLETDEARRLWACFDQPDLKAPHAFTVLAPQTWTVTSNGAPESVVDAEDSRDARVWTFPDTPRLSTYVVVVNAGPFHEVRQQHDGHDLGFYCRQSLVGALERDLDEMMTLTRQGLAFFGERFGVPFPQERYDQVFVPNLGGAMENWGCVTYGDGPALPNSPDALPALHPGGVHPPRDGAHVVRRPGHHALVGRPVAQRGVRVVGCQLGPWRRRRSSPTSGPASSRSTSARPTTWTWARAPPHPQRGHDVNGAMANFDAITYVKGQSVLHQLMAFIGEDAFVEGLRAYFAAHAYGNTVLDDLMSAYAAAAGRTCPTGRRVARPRRHRRARARRRHAPRRVPRRPAPRPHRIDIASYSVTGAALRGWAVTRPADRSATTSTFPEATCAC
jgi:aminopeptidase N